MLHHLPVLLLLLLLLLFLFLLLLLLMLMEQFVILFLLLIAKNKMLLLQVAHIIVDACAEGHTPNHVLGPDALPPPEGEKDDFASDPSMKSGQWGALSTLLHTKESKAMAGQEGHQPIDQDLQDLICEREMSFFPLTFSHSKNHFLVANSKSISSREDFGLFRRRRRGDFRNNSERRPPRKREMVHRFADPIKVPLFYCNVEGFFFAEIVLPTRTTTTLTWR